MFDGAKLEDPACMEPFRILSTYRVDEKYLVKSIDQTYGVAWLRHSEAPPEEKGEHPHMQLPGGAWVSKQELFRPLRNQEIPVSTPCYITHCIQLTEENRKRRKNRWRDCYNSRWTGMFNLIMPEPGMAQELERLVMAHHNELYALRKQQS